MMRIIKACEKRLIEKHESHVVRIQYLSTFEFIF